ncbi:hypothetical protein V8E53_011021 [Lactarius tabidus]
MVSKPNIHDTPQEVTLSVVCLTTPRASRRRSKTREASHLRSFSSGHLARQDITNVFATRASLLPLDANVLETGNERMQIDTDSDMPSSAPSYSLTHPPLSKPSTASAPSHLPTLHTSIPPPILLPVADTEVSTTDRERHVRKNTNYA